MTIISNMDGVHTRETNLNVLEFLESWFLVRNPIQAIMIISKTNSQKQKYRSVLELSMNSAEECRIMADTVIREFDDLIAGRSAHCKIQDFMITLVECSTHIITTVEKALDDSRIIRQKLLSIHTWLSQRNDGLEQNTRPQSGDHVIKTLEAANSRAIEWEEHLEDITRRWGEAKMRMEAVFGYIKAVQDMPNSRMRLDRIRKHYKSIRGDFCDYKADMEELQLKSKIVAI